MSTCDNKCSVYCLILFFSFVALAPSSTFAPAVVVASPAKMQAAAALTEVANGIEAVVSFMGKESR